MALSPELFTECIVSIKRKSDELMDGWLLQGESSTNSAYLIKRVIHLIDTVDLTFEYHVTYSLSYSVPMLSLKVFGVDGKTVPLDKCIQLFKFDESTDIYSTLTEVDHPVLQLPFLTLHPCKTAIFMEETCKCSKNVVLSWLSFVGPPVLLNLLNAYSDLT